MFFRYKAIVKYKTAFYSFYLPVAAAMYIVSVFKLYTHDGRSLGIKWWQEMKVSIEKVIIRPADT